MKELLAILAETRRVWGERLRRILGRNETRFDALLNVLERLAEYKRQEMEDRRLEMDARKVK